MRDAWGHATLNLRGLRNSAAHEKVGASRLRRKPETTALRYGKLSTFPGQAARQHLSNFVGCFKNVERVIFE